MKKNRMTYSKLVKLLEKEKYIKTCWDVVCFLAGYQKVVTVRDLENIMRLRDEHIVD